ncbi:MAG: DUF6129 family protein [Propionivibrio sp.]
MIDQALMVNVMAVLEERPDDSSEMLLQVLREKFPGIHFSLCSDDDVPPRLSPAAEGKRCCLYYVDSGSHCLRLTEEASEAGGLLVAMLDKDE